MAGGVAANMIAAKPAIKPPNSKHQIPKNLKWPTISNALFGV
jgi:hypothetical protein